MESLKDYASLRERAVERLIEEGILHDDNVIAAMKKVPREEFLPVEAREHAYVDTPLPIGYGQTTSALHMTALFCEYGEMKLGQRVLEVGGGCGYMSCVYAEVVAPSEKSKSNWGHVWSAEIVTDLAEIGSANVKRLGYSNRVTYTKADASEGLAGQGPFDLIIVTSAAPEVPEPLVQQLADRGTLLIPVGEKHFFQQLLRIRRADTIQVEKLCNVAFVPLKGKHGWAN
jgi:protein-L-isoaspartate(D-aspartate) O-methyltransferase